jgi:hypothetical protein
MAKTKKAETTGGEALAALLNKGRQAPKEKRETTPVIKMMKLDEIKLLFELEDAKRDLKTAEGNYAAAENALNPLASKLRVERCLADRELHDSIKMVGTGKRDEKAEEQSVTVTATQKKQCKKIAADQETVIRGVAGEQYSNLFEQATTVTIALSDIADKKKVHELLRLLATKIQYIEFDITNIGNSDAQKMMEIVGPDDESAVKVDTEIKPTERFFHDSMFEPAVREMAARLLKDGVVVPYKLSFRT